MEYRVELDIFNGPLDLLLYLIRRDELDIYDIPISQITESYMTYLQALRQMKSGGLDINVAGDFLVMAATLMEIKSATLLPRQTLPEPGGGPSAAEQLQDPRFELVQQLLEYKRFKDSATQLERRAVEHADRYPRHPVRPGADPDEPPPLDLEEVQVWDLLGAFERLLREVGVRARQHEVTYDDTPIDLHAADIEDRLGREGRLTLRQLVTGRTRSEMIGVFLALLELIREKKVLVSQDESAGEDFEIIPAPPEHRATYAGASLHLSDDATPASPPAADAPGETMSSLPADTAAEPVEPPPTDPPDDNPDPAGAAS